MSKKTFWFRFIIYALFGAVIPFVFLTFRFHLFEKVNSISIGGWGVVAILLVAFFIIKVFKGVKKGLPFSIVTQILDGACKVVVPLCIAAFLTYYMQDLMDQIFQFLVVLIACESVAIIANPLPQWEHENKLKDGEAGLLALLSTLKGEDK